jgi:hypothetical protein
LPDGIIPPALKWDQEIKPSQQASPPINKRRPKRNDRPMRDTEALCVTAAKSGMIRGQRMFKAVMLASVVKAGHRSPNGWNTKTAHAAPADATSGTMKTPATPVSLDLRVDRNSHPG